MEYEIDDDPQVTPERCEANRDGGLREDSIFFRTDALGRTSNLHDDAADEDSPMMQFGDAA